MSISQAGPEQLGRYTLVRKLAEGANSEVFLAKAAGPGGFEKSLVIKRIMPRLSLDAGFVSAFLERARSAARLDHPNVVQLFDFGELRGTYFLALEHLEGQTARALVDAAPDRRMPGPYAARLVATACEGVAFAHELGLVHGNLCPDHLVITRTGGVKVIDFGVSLAASESSGFTPKGRLMYQPLEQVLSEPEVRSDVYALGAVLYELVSGKTPYPKMQDVQLTSAIVDYAPVPLAHQAPELDLEFISIVERAMARQVEDRYQDCRELSHALDDWLKAKKERVGPAQLAQLVAGGVSGITEASIDVDVDEDPPEDAVATEGVSYFPSPPPFRESDVTTIPVVVGTDAPPALQRFAAPSTPSGLEVVPGVLSQPSPVPVVGGQVLAFETSPAAPTPFAAIASVSVSSRAAASAPLPEPPSPFGAEVPSAVGPAWRSSAPLGGAAEAAAPEAPSPFGGFFGGAAAPAVSAVPSFSPPAAAPPGPPPPAGFSLAEFSPPAAPGFSSPAAPGFSPPAAGTGPVPPPAPGFSPPAAGTGSVPPPAPGFSPPAATTGFAPPRAPPSSPRAAPAMDPEARSQAVLSSAKAMRMFEAGAVLGAPQELEPVRVELEREEGALSLVRFALSAARLRQANPEQVEVIAERLAGVVEGLLVAEAYGPLAALIERTEALGKDDPDARWVHESLRAALVRPSQVTRLAAKLRELAPADGPGLGRVIGLFGGEYAPAFIGIYESMELPGSREAMQPGLGALAGKNPRVFLERVEVKRPRRLAEFVYFLEKGRAPDRHRVFRELTARPEPVRRRDVLAGLAQAGSDEALRQLTQALQDPDEELRVHVVQLLAKHFPEKALALVAPMLDEADEGRSASERTALWRALGSAQRPEALALIADALKKKPSLINRGKIEQRKLDALEGLAEMKGPETVALLEAVFNDRSQPDAVRASAQRLLAAAQLLQRADEHVEARRWERTPSTFVDVVLDLYALASAARLVEVTSPMLELGFTRLRMRLEALLREQPRVSVALHARQFSVNGEGLTLPEGDDGLSRAETAFSRRGVLGFSFDGPPSVAELQELVRWLALGPQARGLKPGRINRTHGSGFEPLPELPPVPLPALPEPSREAMVRYADLVFALRAFVQQRKGAPGTLPPELRVPLHELALMLHTRTVRFLGLQPATGGHDALIFHTVNACLLALGFASELGLSRERLVALAELALYSDAGQFELPEDTLLGRRPPTKEELAAVRKASLRLPLARAADTPVGARWACLVVEQERGGAEQGVLGGIVALARLWEGLTSTQAPEAALEQLTTKLAARFRADLLPLFVRYVKRQSLRPLKR